MSSAVSAREAEVLDLLGRHLTHAEIAAQLVVSIRTVESHVASLRRKLGIPGHRDLVRYAAAQRTRGTAPVELTSFVGRVRERADLTRAVLAGRLVSLVGTGGAGKTRLARVVADDVATGFPDGVWFADLVPVQDAAALAAAVATACGSEDVPGRDAVEALIRGIGTGRALLVLDNCEHLTNAVAVLVEQLLTRCTSLHVLVTSRARLAVPIERVHPLAGLSSDGEAVALFVDRAVAAGWRRPTDMERDRISAICAALGGLALAIELAAVRLPALGLDGVEAGLSDQDGLLVGGPRATVRHRSMGDTIDWSYRLLTEPDRAVLRRAAVFAGSFDLAAAREVIAFGSVSTDEIAGALGRLADQSLLTVAADNRWRLLEPVRQFALGRTDEADQRVRSTHLSWVERRLADILAESLRPGRDWYGALDEVTDDARAALAWAASRSDAAPAAHLAADLATALFRSGRMREAQRSWEQAADLVAPAAAALDHLRCAAAVAKCRVDGEEALRLERASITVARTLDDPSAVASALAQAAGTVLRFGGMFGIEPPLAEALAMLDEAGARDPLDPRAEADPNEELAAARDSGDMIRISAALDVLIGSLIAAGRPVEAARRAAERVRLFGRDAAEPRTALELKDALHMATLASVGAGDLDAAQRYAHRQGELAFLREQRDVAIEETLAPYALAGRWDELDAAAESWLSDWTAGGRHPAAGRAISAAAVAMAYELRGDDARGALWRNVVADLRGVHPDDATTGTGYGAVFDALVLLDRDRPEEALDRLRSDSGGPSWYGRLFCQWHAALSAQAAARAGDPDAEELCASARLVVAGNPIATTILARAQQPQL